MIKANFLYNIQIIYKKYTVTNIVSDLNIQIIHFFLPDTCLYREFISLVPVHVRVHVGTVYICIFMYNCIIYISNTVVDRKTKKIFFV